MTANALKEQLVGRVLQRWEDPKLMTGHGNDREDIKLPSRPHITLVRRLYVHAKIVSIDASKTLAIPGVVAVFTGKDMLDCRPCQRKSGVLSAGRSYIQCRRG